MSNDEKFNLCTSFLSVLQCSISAFWQAENAISVNSQTGRMNSKIFYILMLRLEISKNTTSISILLLQKCDFLIGLYIYMHSIQCRSNVVSTILLRSVILQKHVQHR